MEESWNNVDRFNAINSALVMVPHQQDPIGLGFRLRHDPTKCVRCKALIAVLELGGIMRVMESEVESQQEVLNIDT